MTMASTGFRLRAMPTMRLERERVCAQNLMPANARRLERDDGSPMPRRSSKRSVFFSYNSKDFDQVRRIVPILEKKEVQVVWDQTSFLAGNLWMKQLEQLLVKQCHAAVVFIGPHGTGRWQFYEMALAI